MTPRFDLSHKDALLHYTPRTELHGPDPESAATLHLTVMLPASDLAMFSPTLRWSLYRGPNGEAPGEDDGGAFPRYPEIESAFKWKREIVGGLLVVHNGIGGVSDIRLPAQKANKFELATMAGGAFELSFCVSCRPDERQHGALAVRQDRKCEVSFESPAADLVEQAEAQSDKPLATVGDADAPARKGRRGVRQAAERAFS